MAKPHGHGTFRRQCRLQRRPTRWQRIATEPQGGQLACSVRMSFERKWLRTDVFQTLSLGAAASIVIFGKRWRRITCASGHWPVGGRDGLWSDWP
jgi:hypothetical protein